MRIVLSDVFDFGSTKKTHQPFVEARRTWVPALCFQLPSVRSDSPALRPLATKKHTHAAKPRSTPTRVC